MSGKNFFITTPIYYPSGKPHMGHAYSSIIADVFARLKRIQNYNVKFLTGTDEHGLKIQREAEKNNKNPQEFCDDISLKFRNLSKTLNLTNDDFIRTTEKRHHKAVKEIWNRLVSSNDIYLSKYSGWYSVSDEAFYSDEEIDTKDNLKVSKISGSKVEWVEEESFFFKLSSWQNKLLEFYKSKPDFILPKSRKNEVVEFVKSGLKDLSVSRTSFSWGIPVPENSKHVIYVWLDALTNYLSALEFPDEKNIKYKQFWPADIHIIGKDILRFHAVYWPAFLMAAKIPLPKRVYGDGWILSEEKKMSKSIGNILDPLDIIKNYGIDQLRYYLIKEVSLGNDGNVSLENLKNCINNDLANNYGNLCQRVFAFLKKNCNNKIPKSNSVTNEGKSLTTKLKKDIKRLNEFIDKQDLNNYIKQVIEYSFDSNKYFNDSQPWSLKKTDVKKMNSILYSIVEQIKNISILLLPIMPISANKILDIINVKKELRNIDEIDSNKSLNHDKELGNIEILFKKVE